MLRTSEHDAMHWARIDVLDGPWRKRPEEPVDPPLRRGGARPVDGQRELRLLDAAVEQTWVVTVQRLQRAGSVGRDGDEVTDAVLPRVLELLHEARVDGRHELLWILRLGEDHEAEVGVDQHAARREVLLVEPVGNLLRRAELRVE